jgi:PAS domain S-box-containing protein
VQSEGEVELDETGQPRRLFGILHDVTQQRRAEEARRLAEHRLGHVVASSPAILLTLLVEQGEFRGIAWMSENVEAVLGYRAEETLGTEWWVNNIHPEDRHAAESQFAAEIRHRGHATAEFRFQHKEDGYRWILGEARLLHGSGGQDNEVIGSMSDITERRELEDQFRHAQKMDAIGHLAGGIAHDFNNLLGVILLYAEFCESAEGTPAQVCEDLQQIRAAADRAVNLTRQLLLFSSRQVMQPAELDLNDVVNNIARMLQRFIGEDVQLQLHLDSVPLMTRADAGMLDQVLLNFAVNARDAMAAGGRLLIETSARTLDEAFASTNPGAAPGRYVCLTVSDSGTGIPLDVLPRIFEPFFTTKAPGKGTGLGLATVYGIVKQHRGWIQVSSEPAHGTTFQVFLPASTESSGQPRQEVRPKPRGGTETILLVEDETLLRMVARSALEKYGYQVLEAENGAAALAVWQANRGTVALLLTDLVMPEGVTGQQLARRLQEQERGLRVIFTSGYSTEIAGRELELRPGENFLQKPFTQDQLLETVRRSLDQPAG